MGAGNENTAVGIIVNPKTRPFERDPESMTAVLRVAREAGGYRFARAIFACASPIPT
jgi:hypothetical protein